MEDKITKIEFKTTEANTGNITINGVPVERKVKVTLGLCENCKNVLVEFQPNQALKDRIYYIQSQLKDSLNYCPSCGCKIDYSGCEIIDAETANVDK